MSNSATIAYFGRSIVEQAIANYFATHGTNEKIRDELVHITVNDEDTFFQMVCDFIDKNS